MIIQWQLTSAGHCMSWVHVATRYVSNGKQHCWEVCYPIWQWRVSKKLRVSGNMLHNILNFLLTRNRIMEILCPNFIATCMYILNWNVTMRWPWMDWCSNISP
jgi:hypothetical protein